MDDALAHRARCRIGADHPSLAGHFPGNPLVPGVVILDQILQALTVWLGPNIHLNEVPTVKFVAPLKPEQPFIINVTRRSPTSNQFQFECVGEENQQPIAKGKLMLRQ